MGHTYCEPLLFAYIACLGACVGSFVNVVVSRLPAGLSVVRPRSRCPQCKKTLKCYDNIPVLSWCVLLGKCRFCQKPIPMRYVLVEVVCAGLFAALYAHLGASVGLVTWLPLSAMLLAIVFLDIDHWWVPDVITYPGMLWALGTQLLPGAGGVVWGLFGLLPAALLYMVGFIFEKLTGKEGMGLGDIKLLAMLGLALGPPDSFTVLMLAAIQGALMGSLIIATGGHKDASHHSGEVFAALADDDWTPHPHAVPFGPFLALACFEVLLLPGLFGSWHTRLASLIVEAL